MNKQSEMMYWNVFMLWMRRNAVRVVGAEDTHPDSWTREMNERYDSPFDPLPGIKGESTVISTDLSNVQQIGQLKKEIGFEIDWEEIEKKGMRWMMRIAEKIQETHLDDNAVKEWSTVKDVVYPRWKEKVQETSTPNRLLFVTTPLTLNEWYLEMVIFHALGTWMRSNKNNTVKDTLDSASFLSWVQTSALCNIPLFWIRDTFEIMKTTIASLYPITSLEDIFMVMVQPDTFVQDATLSIHLTNQYLSPRAEYVRDESYRRGIVFYTVAYTATSHPEAASGYVPYDVQQTIMKWVKNEQTQQMLLTKWLPPYVREIYDVTGKKHRYIRPHDMRSVILQHIAVLGDLVDEFEAWQRDLGKTLAQWEPRISISTFHGSSLYAPDWAISTEEKEGGMNTKNLPLLMDGNSENKVKELSGLSMDAWRVHLSTPHKPRSKENDDTFQRWSETDSDGKRLSLLVQNIIQLCHFVFFNLIAFLSPLARIQAWERFQKAFYRQVRDAPYSFVLDSDHSFTTHFIVGLMLYSLSPPTIITLETPIVHYWRKIWDICMKCDADFEKISKQTGGVYSNVMHEFIPSVQSAISSDLLLYVLNENESLTVSQWERVWENHWQQSTRTEGEEVDKEEKEMDKSKGTVQRYLNFSRLPNALVALVLTLHKNSSMSRTEQMNTPTSNSVFLSAKEPIRDDTVNFFLSF